METQKKNEPKSKEPTGTITETEKQERLRKLNDWKRETGYKNTEYVPEPKWRCQYWEY